MPPKNKGEGTKIAQAAKDLNVTSVTIRRYIAEFDIPTTADENGIKVLPSEAMEELHLIRQLKEDGLTNPKVLEELETHRKSASKSGKAEKKTDSKKASTKAAAAEKVEPEKVEVKEPPAKKRATATRGRRVKEEEPEEEEQAPAAPAEDEPTESEAEPTEGGDGEAKEGEGDGDGRSKHSLTCQTCSKVFEHMNPRLRDCLECYRAKRKERRRGGDKHKNVIQHPLAQQALNKSQSQKDGQPSEDAPAAPAAPTGRGGREPRVEREPREQSMQVVRPQAASSSMISAQPTRHQVRNYRKAIEETRTITANLKRRLERPDLPEAERRWLEQIYAYQLILHQGWRHLSEYKAGNTTAGAGPKEKE